MSDHEPAEDVYGLPTWCIKCGFDWPCPAVRRETQRSDARRARGLSMGLSMGLSTGQRVAVVVSIALTVVLAT